MNKTIKNSLLFFVPTMLAGIIFGLIAFYVYAPKPVKEYDTLEKITQYARELPEQPESDDDNWLDPYYNKFDRSRTPSWPIRFLRSLGVGQVEPWSPRFLAHQLKKLTNKNIFSGFSYGRNNIIHLREKDSLKLYVFGDVHGAFHSVVRDLNYLKNKEIINNDLQVINKNAFLIFNGDYIDRSPYSIDSLILMSLLLEKNPQQVIYLRGNHESNGHWQDYGLKRELIVRGRTFSSQEIPFKEQIVGFFETLPEAVYISGQDDKEKFIRIAFNPKASLPYDEERLSVATFQHDGSYKIINAKQSNKFDGPIDVIASFQTEDWRLHNRIKKGVGFLDQDYGSSAWAVLSSPIFVHKEFLDFFSDAFVELSVKKNVEDATITLYNQDTRSMLGFKSGDPLSVLSGKVLKGNDVVSTQKVIKIASTMSLNRGVPTIGQMAKLGLNLAVNRKNGAHNKEEERYRLYVTNDNYIPKMAKNNINKFLSNDIKYVLFPIGTPTTLSYIDDIINKDMLLLFPITGAPEIRVPKYKNIAHMRVSYPHEARELLKYVRREYASIKFAFFYQDDSFGQGPFKAAVEELARMGLTNYVALPYTRGTINFEQQIKELLRTQPDAVGFFCTAKAAQEFIRQAGLNAVANAKLFGISFAGELTIKRFARRHGLDILFASAVPNPKTSDMPIVKRYREVFDALDLDYDVYSLESFIGTQLFIETVASLKGAVTPRSVMGKIESYRNFDFHGFMLDFEPETRMLNHNLWLETKPDEDWQRIGVERKKRG